jgi:hypothetical protein
MGDAMTQWRGVRAGETDVATDLTTGMTGTNHRYAVDGELRRRRGMAKSSIAKQSACIKAMLGFAGQGATAAATFLTCAGEWVGFTGIRALWNDTLDDADSPGVTAEPPIVGYGVLTEQRFYATTSSFATVASVAAPGSVNGGIIRVGSSGCMITTTAGVEFVDWSCNKTTRYAWSVGGARGIGSANGRYFAGGRSAGAQSSDGVNWTATTYVPGTVLYDLAASDARIVASGQTFANDPWVETAFVDFDNGWTLVYMPDYSSGGSVYTVAAKDTQNIVAVGTRDPGNGTIRICYSVDGGLSYSVASGRPPDISSRFAVKVRSNGSIFLVTLSDGSIWSSVDGDVWTQVYQQSGSWGGGNLFNESLVGSLDGYFYMQINQQFTVYRSQDGANWTSTGFAPSGYLAGIVPRY